MYAIMNLNFEFINFLQELLNVIRETENDDLTDALQDLIKQYQDDPRLGQMAVIIAQHLVCIRSYISLKDNGNENLYSCIFVRNYIYKMLLQIFHILLHSLKLIFSLKAMNCPPYWRIYM